MERITYHLLDGFPARIREGGRNGTWTEADVWKVSIDGHEVPEEVVTTFWAKYDARKAAKRAAE